MAVVAYAGMPTLFITFTCNSNWAEIRRELRPGEQPAPWLIERVWNQKWLAFRREITGMTERGARIPGMCGGCFGRVVGIVEVGEYQKRGLPHRHILLILDREDALRTEDDIDCAISAEIPDPTLGPTHARLHAIVMNCMVHKCNEKTCCADGPCSKGFPKPFVEKTTREEDSFTKVRRSAPDPRKAAAGLFDNTAYDSKGNLITNAYIVAYNPRLLLMFGAHCNVECCNSLKSVKYLYKYVWKGGD